MAKKKNQSKKHRFKYSEPESSAAVSAPMSTSGAVVAERSHENLSQAMAVAGSRNFSYVGGDLRRICIFAGALVLLEIVLWLLFSRTGLGAAIYNLVQV